MQAPIAEVVAAPAFLVDESEFPLVRVEFQGGRVGDHVIRSLLDTVRGIAYRGHRIALVYDARRPLAVTASQRRMIAKDLVAHAARDARAVACSAVVVGDDPFTTGIVTVIGWLAHPLHPIRSFTSAIEAESWAKEKLGLATRR